MIGRKYVALSVAAVTALVLIGIAAIIYASRWAATPIGTTGPRFFPGFFFGWIFLGFIFLWIIFGLLRWIFWPVRYRRWGNWYGPHQYYGDSAVEILRQRYARGEITKAQYDEMMRDLQRPSSQATS